MSQVLNVPIWALGLGVLGLCCVAAAIGYGSAVLSKPSRRTTVLRLGLEFAVAFAVALGLVLGTAAGFSVLSLLV